MRRSTGRIQAVLAVTLVTVVLVVPASTDATTPVPSNGTLTASSGPITWEGGPFTASSPVACAGPADPLCDHFSLFVDLPDHSIVQVAISAPANPGDEYDLYVYAPPGVVLVASSAHVGSNEIVTFEHQHSVYGAGPYEVRVQPVIVLNIGSSTYEGVARTTTDSPSVEKDCIEAVPPSFTGVTDNAQNVNLSVLVLLDGITLARGQEVFDKVADSYAPLNITVLAKFQAASFSTSNAQGIIDEAKLLLGGRRPRTTTRWTDVVFVLTDKDIELLGQTAVAGQADCVGGVRFDDEAFAVGEEVTLEFEFGGFDFLQDATEKTAAHEIGHLLGGQHHHANCVEGIGPGLDPNPCTLMYNDVSFISPNFSTVNGVIVRSHVVDYAAP